MCQIIKRACHNIIRDRNKVLMKNVCICRLYTLLYNEREILDGVVQKRNPKIEEFKEGSENGNMSAALYRGRERILLKTKDKDGEDGPR